MPDDRNPCSEVDIATVRAAGDTTWTTASLDNWAELLRNYWARVEQDNRELRREERRWDDIWRMSYDPYEPSINGNIPVWIEMDTKDTDKMPASRPGVCLNCDHEWGMHSGWGCPPFVNAQPKRRQWCKSELNPKDCYKTYDMKGAKKYSCINQKRLQKRVREQMLSKESLLK